MRSRSPAIAQLAAVQQCACTAAAAWAGHQSGVGMLPTEATRLSLGVRACCCCRLAASLSSTSRMSSAVGCAGSGVCGWSACRRPGSDSRRHVRDTLQCSTTQAMPPPASMLRRKPAPAPPVVSCFTAIRRMRYDLRGEGRRMGHTRAQVADKHCRQEMADRRARAVPATA